MLWRPKAERIYSLISLGVANRSTTAEPKKHDKSGATNTPDTSIFFPPSPPEAQLKHPILPLSCLSLPLIKAYNELGTATESQDWWLYGPGRIIALCGLSVRKRTPRLDGTGAHREVGERERQRGGKQRLKFYIVTFERHFATRYYSVWCVPCCLNLPRNKCFDKRGLKWRPGSKQGTKVFHALITALLSPLLYFGAIKKPHLFVNWHSRLLQMHKSMKKNSKK